MSRQTPIVEETEQINFHVNLCLFLLLSWFSFQHLSFLEITVISSWHVLNSFSLLSSQVSCWFQVIFFLLPPKGSYNWCLSSQFPVTFFHANETAHFVVCSSLCLVFLVIQRHPKMLQTESNHVKMCQPNSLPSLNYKTKMPVSVEEMKRETQLSGETSSLKDHKVINSGWTDFEGNPKRNRETEKEREVQWMNLRLKSLPSE